MKAAPRISESGGSIWSHAAIGGCGEKTILYDFLCESLGNNTAHVDTVRLLQLLYPENNYARRLIYVKFAQQVVRAAGCGDAVAVSILEEAGELMARQKYRLLGNLGQTWLFH